MSWAEWQECDCGRGSYDPDRHNSCYDCFLDRRAEYTTCIICGVRWHNPEFDTCLECSPGTRGRDDATRDLKLVILARDSFTCRYCGAQEGETQVDQRLIRPACPEYCRVQHNHKFTCEPGCRRRHRHRPPGTPGSCRPGCTDLHQHRPFDDNGVRPVKLHIDHIQPCARGGTADQWNLQTLCGVCNLDKGPDWEPGDRHQQAREVVVAAYATYLWDYLSAEEKARLNAELSISRGFWTDKNYARRVLTADFRNRVNEARARREAGQ